MEWRKEEGQTASAKMALADKFMQANIREKNIILVSCSRET